MTVILETPPVILRHYPPKKTVETLCFFESATVAMAPTAVRAARQFVRATLNSWLMPAMVPPSVAVTSELVTNALKASWLLYESPPILLSISADGRSCVVLEVWDSSSGLPQYRPREDGGRGLLIVAALSKTWGYFRANNGKTVWSVLQKENPPSTHAM